ncbi:MAG TPA: PepSY domain-containing protein [Candidatus Binatus sp.]|uniref:PepSY domain-containing protein n=1 Tax=Candidatus Binatus sp. TaxID=2811406 RepID=UPI002C3F2C9A|nr:PepSY domain-containing protein [Candidatus Binatus sp.]
MCRRFFLSLLTVTLLTGTAFALNGEKYLPDASVTLAQARETALKTYPGKIISEELEKESGGSGLRYSFVIRHHTAKHEVGIDAKTGAVLENSVEGKNPD